MVYFTLDLRSESGLLIRVLGQFMVFEDAQKELKRRSKSVVGGYLEVNVARS